MTASGPPEDVPARRDGAGGGSRQHAPGGPQPDSWGAWAFAGVLALVAGYAFYGSFDFAIEIRRWPLGLSTLILICLAVYAGQQAILVARGRDPAARAQWAAHLPEEYQPWATLKTVAATAGFALFLLAAYLLGFLLATALFLPAYMLASGVRRPVVVVGVTLGMLVAVWFMFGGILNAPVARGRLVDLQWLGL